MRPLSVVRTNSVQTNASTHRPVDIQGAPFPSRRDWTWRTRGSRRSVGPWWSCLLLLFLISSSASGLLQSAIAQSSEEPDIERLFLLSENRLVTGTVQHVKSGVIQVNIGELEPLFLSSKAMNGKGLRTVQPGDKLKIILSNENEPLDFHPADESGWDLAIKGRLLQPLRGDHDWAVLQTDWGTNVPFKVAEDARHKVRNIPVGAPALFLFDGHDVIVDATFGTEQALQGTLSKWGKDRKKRGNP